MEHEKRIDEMASLPVTQLLARYCVPAIATVIINALYNMVDRVFVGQVMGYAGIAAVTVGGAAMTLMLALSNLIGIGAMALFALSLGAGEREKASGIINQAFTLLLLLGGLELAAGLLFLPQICRGLGAGGESFLYTQQYLGIIFLGAVFHAVGAGMVGFLRAEGFPTAALVCTAGGAVLNILLDALFLLVFGWEIVGAAIATILAQAFSAGYFLWWFAGSKGRITLLCVKDMRLQKKIIGRIFAMGSSIFAMQGGVFILQVVQQKMLHTWGSDVITGDMAISALGITTNIGGLITQINVGFRQGIQHLFSYNYGARLYGRVRELLWKSIISLFGILLTCEILLFLLSVPAVELFGEPETQTLREFYVFALRSFNIFVPLMPLNSVMCSYYQSVGMVRRANLVSMMRPVFFAIPFILILSFTLKSIYGVFLGMPAADFASCVICGILLRRAWKQLKEMEPHGTLSGHVPEF